VVGPRVGHHEETWLSEVGLDLVGEHAWCEAASNGNSSSVEGKLQHSTLPEKSIGKGNIRYLSRIQSLHIGLLANTF